MLVIVSDLHLSDNPEIPANSTAFEMFKSQIREMAVRASWRGDGTYRPIERLDIILLGDTIDFVQTGRWLDSNIRPWNDPHSDEYIQIVNSITDAILEQNRDSIDVLRSLSEKNGVEVPGIDDLGNPTLACRVPVRIRTHYMVGERDWILNIAGSRFDLIRQKVIQKLGLVNRYELPFPHQSSELSNLDVLLKSHGVHAQHGDLCDPLSFSHTRQSACWENIISLEVVQQFVKTLTETAGVGLPAKFVTELYKTADGKPVSQIGNKVEWLLRNSISSKALLNKYRGIWNQCVEIALETGGKLKSSDCKTDMPGKLRVALSVGEFKQAESSDEFSEFATSSQMIDKAIELTTDPESEIQHVVFGHTHQTQHVALPQRIIEGKPVDCTYFNTGSWRPCCAGQAVNNQRQLIPNHQQVSLLAFYHGDQRESRSFETWQGSVAMPNPLLAPNSASQPSIRAVRSLARSSAVKRPHFLHERDQSTQPRREVS